MAERFAETVLLKLDGKVDELIAGQAVICSTLENYKDMPAKQAECSAFISTVRKAAIWTAVSVSSLALSACGYMATHWQQIAEKTTKLNELLK